MRAWLSFRTPIRGIRVGAGASLPAARVYRVSATGRTIWVVGSTVMLVGLALWLIFSRDETGRLHENFLLAMILAWALWYVFTLIVAALFPPIETPPTI
jgi:hypothetical protein